MIRHIVFWNLHDEADGRLKEENAALMKQKLGGLSARWRGF